MQNEKTESAEDVEAFVIRGDDADKGRCGAVPGGEHGVGDGLLTTSEGKAANGGTAAAEKSPKGETISNNSASNRGLLIPPRNPHSK